MSNWDEEVYEPESTLDSLPKDWSGFTKEKKLQTILDVIEHEMMLVRNGTSNVLKSKAVAALALEGQLVLADFYADAEAKAREAKHIAEYIEAEVASKISLKATEGKKLSEAALNRQSLISEEVKEAKKRAISLEKEHKKWKCVLEILKEAHVFFRNLGKE